MVSPFAHDVPQTPLLYCMRVQATGPWKGPKTSSSFFNKQKPTQKKLNCSLRAAAVFAKLAIRSSSPVRSAFNCGNKLWYCSSLVPFRIVKSSAISRDKGKKDRTKQQRP